MNKYIVELIGTFILALGVYLSLVSQSPIATAVLAGLILMTFVYTIGGVSGAHINPGVTFGAWSIGKIDNKTAIGYIIMQVIGGLLAMFIAGLFVSGIEPTLTTDNNIMIGIAEFIGMALFGFGIASVIYGKTPKDISGVVIGASLTLGIVIASAMGSNGVLNPAVGLAIGSSGYWYIIAALAGSSAGMWLYRTCCR